MNFSLQNSPQIFQGIIMYIIILWFLVIIKTTERSKSIVDSLKRVFNALGETVVGFPCDKQAKSSLV